MATVRASFEFAPTSQAPGTARRVVRELLDAWAVDHRLQPRVELLVTEVVTNAVEHAGGDAVLELDLTSAGDWLQVGLADGSAIRPVVRELDDPAGGRARGIELVAALADRWDSEEYRGGTRVRFDLSAGPPTTPDGTSGGVAGTVVGP